MKANRNNYREMFTEETNGNNVTVVEYNRTQDAAKNLKLC